MLGLCCYTSFSLVEVHGLLTTVVSLVAEHGFQSTDSAVVAHRFSCSTTYGMPMQEMQERWVRSLGQEDPLEEEMAIHSSILT